MAHTVIIANREIPLVWDKSAERALIIRSSKIGVDPPTLFRDFNKASKAEYAVTAFIWLLLPSAVYQAHQTPEDLYEYLSSENASQNMAALLGVIGDMSPDAEKKSSSTKSHSPGSNSG